MDSMYEEPSGVADLSLKELVYLKLHRPRVLIVELDADAPVLLVADAQGQQSCHKSIYRSQNICELVTNYLSVNLSQKICEPITVIVL